MRDSWEYVLDASPPQIYVKTSRRPTGDWLVEVTGELDFYTAPKFREHLNGPLQSGHVDLDLSGLEFCDHAGLRELRTFETEPVRIVAAHQCVNLVMRLCGVEVLLGHVAA
ncbi:STAS domain-containing protein [Actinoplanes sp. NBC_00393]|uniref:STAS domain-containing protein n=1 Tax=Actinoplanes sp. NBC_00393 TaxID=2975953 RepID=UPI002E1F8880